MMKASAAKMKNLSAAAASSPRLSRANTTSACMQYSTEPEGQLQGRARGRFSGSSTHSRMLLLQQTHCVYQKLTRKSKEGEASVVCPLPQAESDYLLEAIDRRLVLIPAS